MNVFFNFEINLEEVFMSRKKTHEQFILDMNELHPNIKVNGQYNGDDNPVDVECLIDGYKWSPRVSNLLHNKRGCPVCSGRTLMVGVNDLWTVRPDIARLLKYPEMGYQLRKGCHTECIFICPYCGSEIVSKLSTVCNFGLSCKQCGDGFSYPSKLMRNVLQYLSIDFIQEYSPIWIKPKRYDFYCIIDRQEYIIEMDGGLGHGNKILNKNKMTLEKSLEIDRYKDDMARQNGINIIRIDCEPSCFEYIKLNILNNLSGILDLSSVDWEYCNKQSQKTIMVDVCNYYKSTLCSLDELSQNFCLCKDTIKKYLRNGYRLQLCPQYKKHIGNTRKILCLSSEIIFDSATDAGKFYNIDCSSILKCCNNIYQHVAGLRFIFLDKYDGNINSLNPDYTVRGVKANSECKTVNVYDINLNYVCTYNSIADTSRYIGISESSVRRSCYYNKIILDRYICYFSNDPIQPDKTKIITIQNN